MNQLIAKVAINRHIIDKNIGGNDYFMAHEWQNVDLPIDELAEIVAVQGHAFCAQLNGSRSSKNYKSTNLVSIDVDAGTTLEEALAHPFSKQHLTFYYTTASHTVEENRFRLCFLLDHDLADPNDYKAIKRALGLRFCADPNTYDPSRISFGNQSAAFQTFDRTIPQDEAEKLIELGQTPPALTATESGLSEFNASIRRSGLKLPRDTQVTTKSGLLTRLIDIDTKTQIHCIFHNDGNVSAFANKNANGSTYVYCLVCQTTWWLESQNEQAKRVNDDHDFTKTIKAIQKYVVENPEKRQFPENLDPKKFPLLGTAAIQIIDQPYLELSALHDGLTLIRSPKGSGKTESLTEIIQTLITSKQIRTLEDLENNDPDDPPRSFKSNTKVLLIGHRQALIRQLCHRLGLNCYLDDVDFEFQQINIRKKRYGVCLDSLWKVRDLDYDLVVIDECEQVLAHMLSDTMKNREQIYKILRNTINKAKSVVALDADLGWTSYLTLTEMRTITSPTSQQNNRLWLIINEHLADNAPIDIYASKEDLIGQLMTDVANGKKLFVTSNSKRLIDRLHAVIAEKFGKNISFAVTSTNSGAEEVQEMIMDFNETFKKYNVVLASPTLGTGVDISFVNKEQVIDCCYGFFETLVNTHLDIDQQIRRVRHPKEVKVWISPRKFNFETDFGVINHQLMADRLMANTHVGFDHLMSDQTSSIEDQFITTASMIVSDRRRSINDLKQNFIKHKVETGWLPNLIAKDDPSAIQGKAFLALGKQIDDEEYKNKLLNAKPINKQQYNEIQEALDDDTHISVEQYWSYLRTNIECFYQSPITAEVIELDNRGQRRSQFKLFKAVTERESSNSQYKKSGSKFNPSTFNRIKDWDTKVTVLAVLLISSTLFHEGKFELSKIYTASDLPKFIKACKNLKKFVEAQFGAPIRADLETKATTQLHSFLKMIGIKTIASSTKSGGKKTYQYMLDPESHDKMRDLCELRNSTHDDWVFINKLHGF